jgi:NAD(P)-dependent dehydrogenase (short-subunit alcohol dehydrogenase family)
VAFITRGGRGQGRAHAVTCAREGTDVIITDVPGQLPSVSYTLAAQADLDETVRQVEARGRRAVAVRADVRSKRELDAAVAAGIAEFGRIDILIANAGIWTLGSFWELTDDQWEEMIAVSLTGVWKSAKAVAPHYRAAHRVDRDHRIGQRPGGRAVHRALRGRQARRHRADEEHRAGTGPVRHPVQRHQPRRDQDADDQPGRAGYVRRAAPRMT